MNFKNNLTNEFPLDDPSAALRKVTVPIALCLTLLRSPSIPVMHRVSSRPTTTAPRIYGAAHRSRGILMNGFGICSSYTAPTAVICLTNNVPWGMC